MQFDVTRILTIPRPQAGPLPESGCWPTSSLAFLQPPVWKPRAEVEHDESFLQPIAYLLLRNANGQVWFYQRNGGDTRLDSRFSAGVGGHVDTQDADSTFDPATTVRQALLRELHEELQATPNDLENLQLRGLIYEGLSAVGRVHLGVLYTARWLPAESPQPRAGESLRGLGFMDLATVANEPRFELWTQLAVQHLLAHP
jgi:predicted NUDIX family phosphoesterase